MNLSQNKGGEHVKATDTPSHTPPGAVGWKDVLQLLKESIRRSRKEEVLLILKKGGDVSAFRKELDLAVGERP